MLVQDDKVPLALKALLTSGLAFLTYHNIHLTVRFFSLQIFTLLQMSMAKTDGFFGYQMQPLDEDSVDPLGSVKKSEEEKEKVQ